MGLAPCHRANSTCDGSRGENAPEAGSQWRKPRAREQRHRWRALRDPTHAEAKARRATGGESTRSMEGALARRELSSLTRRRGRPGLAVRRDGNSRRVATEGVRGIVAGSAHGRKHRAREAWRGGAVDRGPARTAPCRSRGRSGPAPERATLRGSRDGCDEGRSRRFAVKRSSTWSAHPESGSAGLPCLAAARPMAQDVPALSSCRKARAPLRSDALRRRAQPGIKQTAGCS